MSERSLELNVGELHVDKFRARIAKVQATLDSLEVTEDQSHSGGDYVRKVIQHFFILLALRARIEGFWDSDTYEQPTKPTKKRTRLKLVNPLTMRIKRKKRDELFFSQSVLCCDQSFDRVLALIIYYISQWSKCRVGEKMLSSYLPNLLEFSLGNEYKQVSEATPLTAEEPLNFLKFEIKHVKESEDSPDDFGPALEVIKIKWELYKKELLGIADRTILLTELFNLYHFLVQTIPPLTFNFLGARLTGLLKLLFSELGFDTLLLPLYAQGYSIALQQNISDKENVERIKPEYQRKLLNALKIGGFAVGTGVALGLGAFAALPVIIGGMATLGVTTTITTASTVGLASLTGGVGASFTGAKLHTRWKDVKEFEIYSFPIHDKSSFEASPANFLKGLLFKKKGLPSNQTPRIASEIDWNSADFEDDSPQFGNLIMEELRQALAETSLSDSEVSEDEYLHIPKCKALIGISGNLLSMSDIYSPWEDCLDILPGYDLYCLGFDRKIAAKLGNSLRDLIISNAAQVTAELSLNVLTAGAIVVAPPMMIVGLANSSDNVWLVMGNKARHAGELLAYTIANSVDTRPVTLVGYSMGGRAIFYCLLMLYELKIFHRIENVVIAGSPVSVDFIADGIYKEWQQARNVVSSRFINCYSKSDWVLKYLYRFMDLHMYAAGLVGVDEVDGIENYNVSDIISSHTDYGAKMRYILAWIGLS